MRGIGFKQVRTIAAVIKRHGCEANERARVGWREREWGREGGEPTHDELKCPKRGALTVKGRRGGGTQREAPTGTAAN
jgi:hypothetical protein